MHMSQYVQPWVPYVTTVSQIHSCPLYRSYYQLLTRISKILTVILLQTARLIGEKSMGEEKIVSKLVQKEHG